MLRRVIAPICLSCDMVTLLDDLQIRVVQARLRDAHVHQARALKDGRGQGFADPRTRVGLVSDVSECSVVGAPPVDRGNAAVELEGYLGAPVASDDLLERAARDDAPLVQDRDVGSKLLELGQVVRGVDDGCTLVGELADRAQDLAARLHVRADGRLVHEDQARAVHDRHARVEPSLLPARQVGCALPAFFA